MKSILRLSLVACVAISLSNAEDVKSQGKVTGELRSGYISISGAEKNNATAVGGNVKYESASFEGLNAGFAFTTTQDIGELSGDGLERNAEFSGSNGELSVLSEAYLNYSRSGFNLRAGRQVVDTPLADSDDIRMIGNTFEAYIASYELENMVITAGNLQRWHGYDADLDAGWVDTGVDGTWMAGISYSSGIDVNAWFYDVSKETQAIYVDAGYSQKFSEDMSLDLAAQYLKESEQSGSLTAANIYGVSAGLEANGIGLSVAYNKAAKVSGKQSFSGFGGGALFTNMDIMILDEITLDSDAQALVIGASYSPLHNLNLSYAHGSFSAKNSLGAKENVVEQDIIVGYEVNDNLAVEAIIVMSSDEESTTETAFDFDSTQVMVKYNF